MVLQKNKKTIDYQRGAAGWKDHHRYLSCKKFGQKTIYTQLAIGARSEAVKNAHRALELARVIFPCVHSAGNGIPLAAEKKQSDFKTFFLDIGLVSSSLEIQIDSLHKDLNSVARGALAEQFIAQHLLDDRELFERPHLYYWNRQKKGYFGGRFSRVSQISNHPHRSKVRKGGCDEITPCFYGPESKNFNESSSFSKSIAVKADDRSKRSQLRSHQSSALFCGTLASFYRLERRIWNEAPLHSFGALINYRLDL